MATKKKAKGKAVASSRAKASAKAAKKTSKRAAPKRGAAKTTRAKPSKRVATESKGAASSSAAEGKKVPRFSAPDAEGNTISSSDLTGKPYVLYFYPKDDTTGCTREACGFRDHFPDFTGSGLRVIGVSPDSQESHQRFKKKYGLPFTLLADTERKLARDFGVWVKKQNYGREYMGIERSTFLVDGQGVVRRAWRGVRVDGHVDAVLDAARSLK